MCIRIELPYKRKGYFIDKLKVDQFLIKMKNKLICFFLSSGDLLLPLRDNVLRFVTPLPRSNPITDNRYTRT